MSAALFRDHDNMFLSTRSGLVGSKMGISAPLADRPYILLLQFVRKYYETYEVLAQKGAESSKLFIKCYRGKTQIVVTNKRLRVRHTGQNEHQQ